MSENQQPGTTGPRGGASDDPITDTGRAGDTQGMPASSHDDTSTQGGGGLTPSGTDATGGMSDTTTDYAGGKIRGG